MTRISARFVALLVVPFALVALSAPVHAGTKKAAADPKAECQAHAKKKFKAKYQGAKDIALTQSREWAPTSTTSGIGGTGTATSQNHKKITFEWTCVYDTAKGKITDIDIQKDKEEKIEKKK
jgi:hypothetical protein